MKPFILPREGRPGPVLIDIPKNIQIEKTEYKKVNPWKVERKEFTIRDEKIQEAIKLINNAKKPFIYAGGGAIAADASAEVIALAEKINAPICNSLMARGLVPSDHELYTGMIGMHGTKASNISATKCDLFIALGARFSDRVVTNAENLSNAKIIHIDVDAAEINKNIKVDLSIIGDLKSVLKRLLPNINEAKNQEWLDNMKHLKSLNAYKKSQEDELTPEYFFEELNSLDQGNLIISTEVGQHQMWTAQHYNFKKPRTFITSGGLRNYGLWSWSCNWSSICKTRM